MAEATQYEQELASYLQERIKPGLNKGAIPLLARSIAKELANRPRPDGASEDAEEQDEPGAEDDVEPTDEADVEPTDEADVEPTDEADVEPSDEDDLDDEVEDEPEDDEEEDVSDTEQKPDFETDMRELQAELGDEWILTFSVKGDDAWLTAEKEDGSQHVEAQTADLLLEAVELLEEGGGRSG